MNAVEKGRITVLSKVGAFVRRTDQQSIRDGVRVTNGVSKRSKPSKPGRPPKSWTGLLRDFIWFSYDPESQSVVIGPVPLNQFHVVNGALAQGGVPHVLEYGGTIGFREYQLSGGLWVPFGRRARSRQGRPTRVRSVTIAARPHTRPALEKNIPKFPGLWANSIKGAY